MSLNRLPSIRRRLTLTLLSISLLFAGLTAGVVWSVIRHEMGEVMDQELREAGEIIHNLLASTPEGERIDLRRSRGGDYEEHLVWQVVDAATGEVRGRSHNAPAQPLLRRLEAAPVASADGAWRLIGFEFRQAPGRILVVGQSQQERIEAEGDAVRFTLLGAALLGVLSAVLLHWRIGRELRPLDRLSAQVRGFDPMRPATAPEPAGRAELQPIEDAIVDLGHRLAQRIVSERAFTSHAAHALRTPVAGIDAQLAIALREAPESLRPRLGRARQAATRLGRVMQALLTMFRSGMEPRRRLVRLSELLAPLCFSELRLTVEGEAALHGDPDLLAAALLNLLDNAHRHGAREVRLRVSRDETRTCLELADDGDGCAPGVVEHLRDALRRQDYQAESGLRGLGLILADLVARAHGGFLELPPASRGFRVVLCWPHGETAAP